VVLDQAIHSSPTTELADDIISIITVFSARYYGSRKYKHTTSPKDKAEYNLEEEHKHEFGHELKHEYKHPTTKDKAEYNLKGEHELKREHTHEQQSDAYT